MTRLASLSTAAIALVAVLLLAGVASAGSAPVTQTARSGSVSASLTYRPKPYRGGYVSYSGERLKIVRDATVDYERPVTSRYCKGCEPQQPGVRGHSVTITDIDQTGEPNVILGLYTGGAHCCTIAQVFTYRAATHTYVKLEHDFYDPGFKLERLAPGGHYVFGSANAGFAYEFTDFADSGVPIQIWALQNGRLVDVTRDYPTQIAADAAHWLRLFKHAKTNAGGWLAAWAADEELLGNNALVQRTLSSALRGTKLKGMLVAGGRSYIKRLNAFLTKEGYKS